MDELNEKIEEQAEKLKKKKTNAKVFCVSCGAKKRTLRKWHNSYLCVDCFKIAQNVGDEKFIVALRGEDLNAGPQESDR